MAPEEFQLVSARTRLAPAMARPVAGVSFLGLVFSLIGWLNLYGAYRDDRPTGLPDQPFVWFFAVAGSLIVLLPPLLLAAYGFRVRKGALTVISAAGVAFLHGNTLPWSSFAHIEIVWQPAGGRELIGSLAEPLPAETRRMLAPYLVTGSGQEGDRVSLRLGDVNDANTQDIRAALRTWTGSEITERST
jgi:hypothetical protein